MSQDASKRLSLSAFPQGTTLFELINHNFSQNLFHSCSRKEQDLFRQIRCYTNMTWFEVNEERMKKHTHNKQ